MTSKELVSIAVEAKPNPLPYGRLSLRKGVWDQLQAQKAYDDSDEHRPIRAPALDKKV